MLSDARLRCQNAVLVEPLQLSFGRLLEWQSLPDVVGRRCITSLVSQVLESLGGIDRGQGGRDFVARQQCLYLASLFCHCMTAPLWIDHLHVGDVLHGLRH